MNRRLAFALLLGTLLMSSSRLTGAQADSSAVRQDTSHRHPTLLERLTRRGDLPLSPDRNYATHLTYPRFGVSLGGSTFAPDVDGLVSSGAHAEYGTLLWLEFFVRATPTISVHIESSLAIGLSSFSSTALCVRFTPDLFSGGDVRLYLSAGAIRYSANDQERSIKYEGGGAGFQGTIGLDMELELGISLSPFVRFIDVTPIATTPSSPIQGHANMSSTMIGLMLNISML